MPLSAYRVLQLGTGVGLDFCAKLFADFGADVIKLELPGGDPLRRMPPIVDAGEIGLIAWANTHKGSVTETPEALAALLDATPVRDRHDTLRIEHPGLAVTAISWFGDHGPYANFAATEATIRALGGLAALTGRAEGPSTLGQDNEAIPSGRLGLSREQIDRLAAADVIGTLPKPRRAQIDR